MNATLGSLLSFYSFSTGRRLFAVGEVKTLAAAANLGAIAVHCDAAIAHDTATRDLEARWASDKDANHYSPEARQIDILVDTALGALRNAVDAEVRDAAPGDPLGEAAGKLQQILFPSGLAAITTATFVDELAEVQRIIGVLLSAEWSNVSTKLGLDRRLARLVDLEKVYKTAIGAPTKTVTFDEVKEARAKGQALMLQAVAMVLGVYPSNAPGDVEARQKLLEPIFRQNDAIRDYLKARRAIEDVDPATGQVEPNPAPAPTPGSNGGTAGQGGG